MKPDKTKLRAARERAGLTQKSAAQLLGVGPQTLLRWERGHSIRSPSRADLAAVAAVYGCDLAELCMDWPQDEQCRP